MEDYIKRWCNVRYYCYVKNTDANNRFDVYNLLINGILTKNNDSIVNLYYGHYYRTKHNDELMIKHYLIAINLNNNYAVLALAKFYDAIGDVYYMEKYYLIAANLNNIDAMVCLGNYYRKFKDHDNMIKYLLMAINLDNSDAMEYLAQYYNSIGEYDTMMKYYLMAIELGSDSAMALLADYYAYIKDYDNMLKYYVMSSELKNQYAFNKLADHYSYIKDYDNMVKYYMSAYDKGINKLINYAIDNKCSKILSISYNNYLQYTIHNYHKIMFTCGIITFLKQSIINSDLLLLIVNIEPDYFSIYSKLLIIIQKLLNNKIILMNTQFSN